MEYDINYVRSQIGKKLQDTPYFSTENNIQNISTDYDTFPYPRWFRGQYKSSNPIVAERVTGWRPRRDACYQIISPPEENEIPNHCFEAACSTVYPCYPSYLQKISDRDALNVALNNACIVQYR